MNLPFLPLDVAPMPVLVFVFGSYMLAGAAVIFLLVFAAVKFIKLRRQRKEDEKYAADLHAGKKPPSDRNS